MKRKELIFIIYSLTITMSFFTGGLILSFVDNNIPFCCSHHCGQCCDSAIWYFLWVIGIMFFIVGFALLVMFIPVIKRVVNE